MKICLTCANRWTRQCPRRTRERKGENITRFWQSCKLWTSKKGEK